MIVEDHDVSDRFFAFGDGSRRDHEDSLLSQRRGVRQSVGSNHHHSFLKRSKIDISENFENLQTANDRHERRPLSVLVSLDWSGRIETEQENHQGEDYRSYAHGFFAHRQKITRPRKPNRTPSNGLVTTNQKERSQPESWTVRFVFTLFFSSF
jgi:hypothetical protein